MKNIYAFSKSAFVFLALAAANPAEAKTYTAIQSGKYTDINIWQPEYPGITIKESDSIIITSQIVLNTAITIDGLVTVEKGASLQGNKDLQIGKEGKLINKGNTVVRRLSNEGQLDNQLVFETMLEVENKGIINNMSATVAGTSLLNQEGILGGNKGSYFSNSSIISEPGSIYGKDVKLYQAAYTNPMAEIDEAIFCQATLNAVAIDRDKIQIEIVNRGQQQFTSVILEKSTDGVYFTPITEAAFHNNKYTIDDMRVTSAHTHYRAFAYDVEGKKYRMPETIVKISIPDETLSMANRISN